MKIKKGKIIIYYRLIICILTLFFISKLTILGDFGRYIAGDPVKIIESNGSKFILNSTVLTEFLVGSVKKICLGNSILTSLLFNLIGSCGIVYFFKSTSSNKIIFTLLLFPSFTIWSSYPSKELLSVLATSLIMGNLIKIYENRRRSKIDKILLLLGLFLTYVYKKQYLICILFLGIYIYFRKKIKFNFRCMIYFIYLGIVITILYLFRDKIDIFLRNFHLHFDYGSKETVRNLFIFREKYGFFKNVLYGMFISFFGPSLFEIKQGGLKASAFIESLIIIGITVYSIIQSKKKSLEQLFLFFNGMVLLLLPQYPFGVFNSGSAIRYRTNLYIIFLGLLYIFVLRNYGESRNNNKIEKKEKK